MRPRRQSARLADGGLIDRSRLLQFRFDGREYAGHPGDTLASALVANGVRIVGRSFKYHRPRGLLSAGAEEPNALVALRGGARREPNTRATVAELFDGLEARSQNRWPSLGFDLLAFNRALAPIFAAGFYYKTFMWPAGFWEKVYEPLIRRAAGLGRGSYEPDPDHYEKANAHCDVLVIGAGPAGLSAALTAARAGVRVLLVDDDSRCGGRLLAERLSLDARPGHAWAAAAAAELVALPNCRLLSRTSVVGAYDGGVYAAVERVNDHVAVPPAFEPRQRLWRIHARRCVLASGAIERPLLFGNNDLPGVMLAGAARSYVNRHAARPGTRAVVYTTCDDGWRTVADLAAAGVDVVAVIDPRRDAGTVQPEALPSGCRHIAGEVSRALGGNGVRAIEWGAGAGSGGRLDCDLVAVAGGWTPSVHLTSHLGGRPRWDEAIGAFVPGALPPGMVVAGAANGAFTLAAALASGIRAARESLSAIGVEALPVAVPASGPESDRQSGPVPPTLARGKCFVDLQHDVTSADIELATREGFAAAEHAKRYTTLGMATDQGKTSNVNGLAVLAHTLRTSIVGVGTTSFRPPYVPVAIGALAGHHRARDFRPTRLPPGHDWAERRGAVFVEAGPWLRAQYYPAPGERGWLETVDREVRTVREAVGICDVSTLGKIDVQGGDALQFLERLYANDLQSLAIGRCRYGLMLREDGHVFDDGTVARLGEAHYVVTTTTANAVAVFQHMQFCHQVLWPTLDVQFVSVTEQWAQFSIAGPRARDVLQGVVAPEYRLDNSSFPFMAAATIRLRDGTGARLFRISFSGELAYELAVPARRAEAGLDALMRAGAAHGICAYGTEALGVMRIEKGHVAGNELTGQTTAADLGLGRMLSGRKDFIGAVMARRAGLADPGRPRLVGFRPVERNARPVAGAHFVARDEPATAAHDAGYVTSVAHSPSLGHWIGLGLLRGGADRAGERVRACDPLRGGEVLVEICSPVFVDPIGARLRV